MAEGFEPYHVPQQSRRDKLRVAAAAAAELHGLMTAQLPPPYDHRNLIEVSGSSSPSDLLTCTPTEDNLMAMAGLGSSASSSGLRNPYGSFDPSLLYGAASQMMHTGAALFKPEPLSLSLSSSYNNNDGMGINDGVSRGSVPLGPFTGYASVLKGSRFLLPAQQLLEELCCEAVVGAVSPETLAPDSSLMVMDTNAVVDDDDDDYDHHHHDRGNNGDGDDDQNRKNKSTLISMLHEVYRRYKQYYQQMQAVVTSFEYVAGLGNAAPYASLAVKAMTRHFRCLKNAIMDQLQFANKESNGYPGHHGKDETAPTFRNNNNNKGVVYGQMVRPSGHHGFDHQPVWRPQRGLPERAVTVLRAWLFEHFLHPYPTDTDKLMLAKQTGLSRSQVSNWFINARVRLWKPMVEEIHMLETRQAQNNNNNKASVSASMTTTRPNNDTTANHPKRSRNDNNNDNNELIPGCLTDGVIMGLSYEDGPAGPSGSGVSLTLGLHQDDDDDGPGSMCLAQRFGIGEGYVVAGGAFEAAHHHQTRHFGSQLLRDFVG